MERAVEGWRKEREEEGKIKSNRGKESKMLT